MLATTVFLSLPIKAATVKESLPLTTAMANNFQQSSVCLAVNSALVNYMSQDQQEIMKMLNSVMWAVIDDVNSPEKSNSIEQSAMNIANSISGNQNVILQYMNGHGCKAINKEIVNFFTDKKT